MPGIKWGTNIATSRNKAFTTLTRQMTKQSARKETIKTTIGPLHLSTFLSSLTHCELLLLTPSPLHHPLRSHCPSKPFSSHFFHSHPSHPSSSHASHLSPFTLPCSNVTEQLVAGRLKTRYGDGFKVAINFQGQSRTRTIHEDPPVQGCELSPTISSPHSGRVISVYFHVDTSRNLQIDFIYYEF